jgi:hypothetical protein
MKSAKQSLGREEVKTLLPIQMQEKIHVFDRQWGIEDHNFCLGL